MSSSTTITEKLLVSFPDSSCAVHMSKMAKSSSASCGHLKKLKALALAKKRLSVDCTASFVEELAYHGVTTAMHEHLKWNTLPRLKTISRLIV